MRALLARLRDRPGLAVVDAFDGAIERHDVRIDARCRWVDRPLAGLPRIPGALVGLVTREGESFVPGGADVLRPGDVVAVLGLALPASLAAARLGARPVGQRLRVLGASAAAIGLAARLAIPSDDVGLICQDAVAARVAARAQPHVAVWLGTPDALRDEAGLDEATVVDATALRSEAPTDGARRKLALAPGVRLWDLAVTTGSGVGAPLRSLLLPGGAIVVGRFRGGRTDVPRGRDAIASGDRVLVVVPRAADGRLQRAFQAAA